MGNQQWTIQTNWQHKVHEKKNATQYVLDTTIPALHLYFAKTRSTDVAILCYGTREC